MTSSRNIKVFVSYSSLDAALAHRLATDLRRCGFDVWLDQWALTVGKEFAPEIERGVDDADALLVLLTPNSVDSKWVEIEWQRKQAIETATGKVSVIPVRGGPCELPDFLHQRSFADVSGGSYPLGFQHLVDLLEHFSDAAPTYGSGSHYVRAPERWTPLNVVTPIALEIARDLIPLFDGGDDSRAMSELLPGMRAAIQHDLGFLVPGVRVRGNETDMPGGAALIMIEEIPTVLLTVPEDVDRAEYLIEALGRAVRAKAAGFLGPDEARRIIEAGGPQAMDLAAKLIPAVLTWFEIVDVLRRLVEEGVHIGDIRRILDAIAKRSDEDDTVALGELARHALRHRITPMLADEAGAVSVFRLGDRAEELLTTSIQSTSSGSYLALKPDEIEAMLGTLRHSLAANDIDDLDDVALLTTVRARPFMRKLAELEFPGLRVVSREDLLPTATIQHLGVIELDAT